MSAIDRETRRLRDLLDAFEHWRTSLPAEEAQKVRTAYAQARETMTIDEATDHTRRTFERKT